MKSDRLKKLESELSDLEQWMKLGLVPKKEVERHSEEIEQLRQKISEERERIAFLKESGDVEEYTAPVKRAPAKSYPETPSLSDIEVTEEASSSGETDSGTETEGVGMETAAEGNENSETEEYTTFEEEEDDPFSDKNRWKRGGILDPDTTDW